MTTVVLNDLPSILIVLEVFMRHKEMSSDRLLHDALFRYASGLDPTLIELPEKSVFPGLIPAAPATARKARCTGMLLGKSAPRFVRRGRYIRYRLKDVLDWLADADLHGSTAEAAIHKRGE